MNQTEHIESKIYSLDKLNEKVKEWKKSGKKISFTNGCFDILHKGHIHSLAQAAQEGEILIVGINSDASVKKLKGFNRPLNNEQSRALIIAALEMVKAVIIFNEDTPLELIKSILPNVLVKGGDYTLDQIAGAKEVINAGGKIVLTPIVEGFSTTALLEKASKN